MICKYVHTYSFPSIKQAVYTKNTDPFIYAMAGKKVLAR